MSGFTVVMLTDGSHLYRRLGWVLEYKGCLVLRASSNEALGEALPFRQFDLILAQVKRKGEEKLAVLKQAKRIHPQVRMILCSGNRETTFPLEAYELEADDYLFMPCRLTEIWRRVAACLKISSGATRNLAARYRFMPINRTILENSRRAFEYFRYNLSSSASALKTLVNTSGARLDKNLMHKIFEVSARLEILQEMTEGFCRGISGLALINDLVQGEFKPAFPFRVKAAPAPHDSSPLEHL